MRKTYQRTRYQQTRDTVLARTSAYAKTEAGKRAHRVSGLRQRLLYPEKARARMQVKMALRKGELQKLPCEKCGSEKRIEAHHDDYSKPLDVQWLCKPCHDLEHASHRHAKTAPLSRTTARR